MLIRTVFVVAISLLVLKPCAAKEGHSPYLSKTSDPAKSMRSIYNLLCQGDIIGFDTEIQKLIRSDRNNLAARVLTLSSPNGLFSALLAAKDLPKNVNQLSKEDRIFAAAAIARQGERDLGTIHNLIDFHSSNQETEGFRLSLEAYLEDLKGDSESAFEKRVQAFELLKNTDGGERALLDLINAGPSLKDGDQKLKPYYQFISQLPDDDFEKYLMSGTQAYIESKGADREKVLLNYSRAFELCRTDSTVVINYVPFLMETKDWKLAEGMLLQQTKLNESYSPWVDFLLAKIYLWEKDQEKAKEYLFKAKAREVYLSPEARGQLLQIEAQLNKNRWSFAIIICGVVALLSVILFLSRKRRSPNKAAEGVKDDSRR